MEATKIHEWSIVGQPAELWIVKGKLQIRHRGTIHNTDIPHIRGHWMDIATKIKCSQCGTEFNDDIINMSDDVDYPKFCPNCGSDNRGEEQ